MGLPYLGSEREGPSSYVNKAVHRGRDSSLLMAWSINCRPKLCVIKLVKKWTCLRLCVSDKHSCVSRAKQSAFPQLMSAPKRQRSRTSLGVDGPICGQAPVSKVWPDTGDRLPDRERTRGPWAKRSRRARRRSARSAGPRCQSWSPCQRQALPPTPQGCHLVILPGAPRATPHYSSGGSWWTGASLS